MVWPFSRKQPEETLDAALDRLWEEAVAAAQAGQLAEAAEKLEHVRGYLPDHPDVCWNLGTWRAQLQQHEQALEMWDTYRRRVPEDWRALPKVIQACQALGDRGRRDRERATLLALHAAGTDPALAREPRYCREQFSVGQQGVLAYEVFEPTGPMRVFYVFLVGAPVTGELVGHYSVGSYDFTTDFQRGLGQIGPDDRIYHLDWYTGALHSTVGFYNVLPEYELARSHVVAAMAPRASA